MARILPLTLLSVLFSADFFLYIHVVYGKNALWSTEGGELGVAYRVKSKIG